MARGGLKPGILPGLLGYRLRVAQQALFRDFQVTVAELSPGRVGILLLVEANPGVTQSRLAQAVSLERSTMVGGVPLLQGGGPGVRRGGARRPRRGVRARPPPLGGGLPPPGGAGRGQGGGGAAPRRTGPARSPRGGEAP